MIRFSLRSVLKHVVYTLILLSLIVAQTTFFGDIEIFGVRPQAVLLFLLALSFFEGAKIGAVYGVIGGYVLDVMSGGGIYFSAVIYMLVCYLASYAVELWFNDSYPSYAAMSAVFVIIKQVVDVFVMLASWSDFNLGQSIVKIFLPELFYTVAVSALVYYPVLLISSGFNREN